MEPGSSFLTHLVMVQKSVLLENPTQKMIQSVFCDGKFFEVIRGELWVQCIMCEMWAHCDCADCEKDDYTAYTIHKNCKRLHDATVKKPNSALSLPESEVDEVNELLPVIGAVYIFESAVELKNPYWTKIERYWKKLRPNSIRYEQFAAYTPERKARKEGRVIGPQDDATASVFDPKGDYFQLRFGDLL
ncbi:hypothetical protein NQ317_018151 [Molorchus minor]|uniref:Uncharacterized protein n=1 Tax=Molorchus minor TaxID=1323400 RepID=A0ABQ9J3H0_9CUCU|nr:hypothetical protein NQ317_018151 [Molorchus minor]